MGGIGIGLAAAGYEVVAAYDAWPEAVAVYNHNAPKPVAKACDVLSEEGKRTIRKYRRELGEIHLLAAGPPCKGFSQIRNGHHFRPNPHNQVLLAMPEYVALFRPRLVLIENVPDLARHRDGDTLRELMNHLERPGPRRLRYRVEYCVYDAALYGAPQARRRLLILCVRHGDGDERLPPESPDLGPLYAALRPVTFGGLCAARRNNRAMIITHPLWNCDLQNTPGHPQLAAAYAQAVGEGCQRVDSAAPTAPASRRRGEPRPAQRVHGFLARSTVGTAPAGRADHRP
jgi:site-specific DNA-cytosine methylase